MKITELRNLISQVISSIFRNLIAGIIGGLAGAACGISIVMLPLAFALGLMEHENALTILQNNIPFMVWVGAVGGVYVGARYTSFMLKKAKPQSVRQDKLIDPWDLVEVEREKRNGDFSKIISICTEQFTFHNDSDSAACLGWIYYYVPQYRNQNLAFVWLKKAALRGHEEALGRLIQLEIQQAVEKNRLGLVREDQASGTSTSLPSL